MLPYPNPYELPRKIGEYRPLRRKLRFSLGLKLTALNCLGWGLLFSVSPSAFRNEVWQLCGVLLSLPLALPCVLPSLGPRAPAEVVFDILAIAVNCPIWGYGLAWILKRFRRMASF